MNRFSKLAGISAAVLVLGGIVLTVISNPDGVSQASVPAAQPKPARTSDEAAPTVASLGELQLSSAELNAVLSSLTPQVREQLRGNRGALEGWIRARLAEKALLQQADAQGWQQRPDIQQMTRAATEQILLRTYLQSVSQVPADYPDEQALQQAYEGAKDKLQSPALYRVSQIFIAVEPGANEEPLRKKATELARRAQAPNADFAELARQFSEDQATAQRGGDSGLQPLQQYVPEMRQVLSRQRVGSVSDALRSQAGFHILKLTDMQPARAASLDEVREQLREALRNQRQEQVARAYMEGLVSKATLSIDGAQLNQALESVR
ncbi:peptidylprolyl isomerase [Pseudomonas brassicacearum]|jgi:peptidylprolyl isomerase|uniref:Peptidylprolyl isomerase n=1 Tax=Pseudomonas brassicacearum subsp. neoaurantiaca TaxID=494916 RepID=A0A7V8ZUP0_9PSED|nr:peptidylprolyl isomerase [Pseudomonas brassicacearum]MBA1380313.1 peptidylprolyl isomerase [Pseudomonas brassicacearum subsp. neoaurantiaca]